MFDFYCYTSTSESVITADIYCSLTLKVLLSECVCVCVCVCGCVCVCVCVCVMATGRRAGYVVCVFNMIIFHNISIHRNLSLF